MNDEFFEEGDYQQSQQPITYNQQPHQESQQNHWQKAEIQSSPVQQSGLYTMGSQNGYSSNIVQGFGSSNVIQVDDQVTRRIADQQNRMNQILREKSEKEYEQKQGRKATGNAQLQEFFNQKERQLVQRKEYNIENEKKLIQRAKTLTQKAGWQKVFENVNLKLGDYKGGKSVNRMRESIMNKYEDERNNV